LAGHGLAAPNAPQVAAVQVLPIHYHYHTIAEYFGLLSAPHNNARFLTQTQAQPRRVLHHRVGQATEAPSFGKVLIQIHLTQQP
jgi:hypothetical protein